MEFGTVEQAIADIKAGKLIIVADDEDRENEGDLICAAELVTPELVNFMIRKAGGWICLALTGERADELELPQQSEMNNEEFRTAFTISIDADERFGVTTGVSAQDRARTIRVAVDPATHPSDLRRPGHVPPVRARDEGTLLFLLPVVGPFFPIMTFVADPFQRLFDRSRRRDQVTEDGEEEEEDDDSGDLQALIDVGEAEGILEEEEGELIHSIIEFGDTRVSEVMTPRPDIVAVPEDATVREARDIIIESKYSRLPVYREQIDNVEGMIYVRDLLQYWAEGREDESIRSLVRSVYFVPETKPVADLLEEMQKAHAQLAMVIDEYGGVCGLVTVEDILEEIVGEIEDEDIAGEELEEIVEGNDGSYEVLGSTEIGKVEQLFDMEIEDDDFTTIAGLVINESGKVPAVGERLTIRGLAVEVLQADERRILRLRVRKAPEEDASEADYRESKAQTS